MLFVSQKWNTVCKSRLEKLQKKFNDTESKEMENCIFSNDS